MTDGQWYWCLRHHAVEPYEGCKAEDRLGPYATFDEATAALDTVQRRNEQWDREDEEYERGKDAPSGTGG